MGVTLDEVVGQLDLDVGDDLVEVELPLLVDAANEWVAGKVTATEAVAKPSLVRLATIWLVGFWWEAQRGQGATTLIGDELVTINGIGFAIPNKVADLLVAVHEKPGPTGSFPAAAAWPDPVEWLA